MANDDATIPLLQAEIEWLRGVLTEKGFEAREIRAIFDAEAKALQNAEIHGAELQAALAVAQSETQQAHNGSVKMQEQLKSWVERATRAETKLEEAKKARSPSA